MRDAIGSAVTSDHEGAARFTETRHLDPDSSHADLAGRNRRTTLFAYFDAERNQRATVGTHCGVA
jgi:hypothetical protein